MPIIEVGSKVMAITSSAKNGIGPRRGSIGYVFDITMNTVYTDKTRMFAQPVKVVFIRYGFESKMRREKKPFINILPITQKNTMDNYTGITEDKNISNDLLWTKMKTSLAGLAGRNKIAHGILAPLETDLMHCDIKEFFVWLESQILSMKFYIALASVSVNSEKLNGIVDTKALSMLLAAADNKSLRDVCKKACQKDAVFKKLLIKTIRQITSINLRDNHFNRDKIFRYLMKKGLANVCAILANNCYVDSEYYWKRDIMIRKGYINRNTLVYIDYLTKTRKELKRLARAYERKQV